MAYLFEVDRVKYRCSCESEYPLCRLYFCRYCICLRCADCTQHEADVYFCPQCLQSHMAPEAKLYHMRCKTCFECPSCGCVLSLRLVTHNNEERANTPPIANKESELTPAATKKYYLSCGYCRWTSRDAGYEDKELTDLHESFFDTEPSSFKELKEAYQLISLRDASEKTVRNQTSQGPRRRNYASLALKEEQKQSLFIPKLNQFGPNLTSLSNNTVCPDEYKRFLESLIINKARQLASISPSDVLKGVRSIATDTVEPLPESLLNNDLDLTKISSLSQRHEDVSVQPESPSEFRPVRKRLAIKKSVRCKQCDHSLCKPEFSTSNIRFKIQLLAQLQIPEVRICPGYKLVSGKECDLVLSVSNPDQLSTCAFKLSPDKSNPTASCEITTPEDVEFTLESKNEAFSLDDSVESDPEKERWLSYNHGSKIGVKCCVKIPEGFVGKALVCVFLQHTPNITSSETKVDEMEFPITIDLGHVV